MRPLSTFLTAATAGLLVVALPSSLRALGERPADVLGWWTDAGTAAATVAVLQLFAIAGFVYVAAVAGLVVIADGLRLTAARRVVLRLATPQLRRALTVGVVAGAVALPSPAFAEESIVTVTDVGPAETSPDTDAEFVLTDLGPANVDRTDDDGSTEHGLVSTAAVRDSFRPQVAAAHVDAWLVEPGDNLWRIAESVLAEHFDTTASEEATISYWNALIDANATTVTDADLIFPGQVLTLPPATTAGS